MSKQAQWIVERRSKVKEGGVGSLAEFYTNEVYLVYIVQEIPSNVVTVLDVGSGKGIVGKFIEKEKPGCELSFLDVNAAQLEGIQGNTIQADILSYTSKEQYDCVVSRLVSHCFTKEDQGKVFSQSLGLVREGGVYVNALLLTTTAAEQRAMNRMFEILESSLAEKTIQRHVLDMNELARILARCGLNYSLKRYSDFAITHPIQDFAQRFTINEQVVEEIEKHWMSQPDAVKEYFSVREGPVRVSVPLYILSVKK